MDNPAEAFGNVQSRCAFHPMMEQVSHQLMILGHYFGGKVSPRQVSSLVGHLIDKVLSTVLETRIIPPISSGDVRDVKTRGSYGIYPLLCPARARHFSAMLRLFTLQLMKAELNKRHIAHHTNRVAVYFRCSPTQKTVLAEVNDLFMFVSSSLNSGTLRDLPKELQVLRSRIDSKRQ